MHSISKTIVALATAQHIVRDVFGAQSGTCSFWT